jgi:hypothetical protein
MILSFRWMGRTRRIKTWVDFLTAKCLIKDNGHKAIDQSS